MPRWKDLTVAFWLKVGRSEECWVWLGVKDREGYGRVRRGGKLTSAHREAYRISYGGIPAGMHVLHTCDNPACVRPDHLKLGTHVDNMHDCTQKGRRPTGARNGRYTHPEKTARGERHPRAKLTQEQVREIRRLHGEGVSLSALSRTFGIDRHSLRKTVRGEYWTEE